MKDVYMKPTAECIEIEPTLIAMSTPIEDAETEDNIVAGVRKRDPQQWGNLWE